MSLGELKKALNTISISDCNKDVKKMLNAIQMICEKILQERVRCEEHEEDTLSTLGKIQNGELKKQITLLESRRDRGRMLKCGNHLQ